MSEALSIKRRQSGADEFSFERLRRDGISYAQQFSGRLWTDYNLHDPGITILEQLCYALTDLIQRADFDVADYLLNADGSLDFERLALHSPETIFAARPTTLADYSSALLAALPQLDRVWLRELKSGNCRGLYQAAIKFAHGVTTAEQEGVIESLRRHYNAIRNLGEELASISVVRDDDYELAAEIEVSGERPPAEILAEIYFTCAHLVDDCTAAAGTSEFLLSTLFAAINDIAAVDHIRDVHLEKAGQSYYESIVCDQAGTALNLTIPRTAQQLKVVLTSNGRRLPLALDDMRVRFDELEFAYHSRRQRDTTPVRPLPQGRARPLADYFSIQNQFPSAYGIGPRGVPASAPAEVKARARQLKAYLLIFEQIMANYLANIDFIKTLFSLDAANASYASQALGAHIVADFDALFNGDAARDIGNIVAAFDNATERKSRLLDYLLALYGESFAQHSLRHFNYYYSQSQLDEVIVDNKLAFLQAVLELGRDRAAAADLNAPPGSAMAFSGLQRRVSLLLGFGAPKQHSLTAPILGKGLKLLRHDVYKHKKLGDEALMLIELATLDALSQRSFEVVADGPGDKLRPLDGYDASAYEIPLRNNMLSDLLLRQGIYLDRYLTGRINSDQDYQLMFRLQDELCWNLGSYADRHGAIQAAHGLREFLIHLNAACEGLHVVEHILLRPAGTAQTKDEFYSLRLSVLFPAWSARCHDDQFRLLAQETVRLNTPAHLHVQFYWLDFDTMYEFELLHEHWLGLKREIGSEQRALDEAAAQVVEFLQRHTSETEAWGDDHGHG